MHLLSKKSSVIWWYTLLQNFEHFSYMCQLRRIRWYPSLCGYLRVFVALTARDVEDIRAVVDPQLVVQVAVKRS